MRTFYLIPGFLEGLTKTLLAFLFLIFIIPTTQAQSGDRATKCGVRQSTVNHNGFVYEIWQSKDNTDGCMVVKNNGDFYASWSKIENTLVRKSKRPGKNNQRINFSIDNKISGNSFYSSYGWWRDTSQSNEYKQIVEYYVVEGYGVHKPVDGLSYKGNYTVSGEGTYELWIGANRYDPTVYGSAKKKFTQIKSIRTSKRSSGNISMASHFNKWASEGFAVKNLFEVSMKVEGFSQGSHDPTKGGAYVSASMSTSGTYNGGSTSTSGSGGGGTSTSGTISGTFRLKARSGGRYPTSNNSNWAVVRETVFENWSSQHWTFERVSGNVYRIKEEYGNRYLTGNNDNGKVTVSNLNTSVSRQKWTLEKVGTRYRLKCGWGGKYLTSPNSNWGTLKLQSGSSGNNREWTLERVSGAKAALADVVESIDANKEISVYPNPSNDFVNLDLSGYDLDQQVSVVIYDMQGRAVNKVADLQEFTTINTSQLPTGSYILRFISTAGVKTTMFSKN